LAGVLVSLLFAMRNPNVMPVTESEQVAERPKLGQLLRESSVVKFLALMALLQGSHAAYYSFSAIYWKEAGHSEAIIGYLWSLAVVAEVAVFALSKRLFAGLSLRTLFVIAGIGVMARWGITASTTAIPVLLFVQSRHGLNLSGVNMGALLMMKVIAPLLMVALQTRYLP
ncbi:MAG: 3-phenylpropionate MFS transporter, partial [Aestuariibacter sp.]|nr:3-phenylpropionate MFS transporter [Aestuariibacter sp.]